MKDLKHDLLFKLMCGQNLTEAQAFALFTLLFQKKLSRTEAKVLLVLLAQKGETLDEIAGCYRAVRKMEPAENVRLAHLIDTCGTGGDGSHSFNISTVAAFVAAGAGARVAKHGNRAVSSRCGSSDLMEALGVKINAPKRVMLKSLRRYGIAYFHAPFYHPLFRDIAPLRRELGIRTVFNLIGPLLNPLRLKGQVLGVANPGFLDLYASIYKKIRGPRITVCHSRDGLDEISTSAKTQITESGKGRPRKWILDPVRFGFKRALKKAYAGGSAKQNAKIAVALLKNKKRGPLRDVILLNAAAGLAASGLARDLHQGLELAERSLSQGNAYKALQGLIRLSRQS